MFICPVSGKTYFLLSCVNFRPYLDLSGFVNILQQQKNASHLNNMQSFTMYVSSYCSLI